MGVRFDSEFSSAMQQVNESTDAIAPQEEVGCWQRTKNGVYWVCRVVVKASGWFIEMISGFAFSLLRVVWPGGADRVEAFWGRIVIVYERMVSAIREESLLEDIHRLEEKNQALEARNQELASRIEQFRVGVEHFNWEKGALTTELDSARSQRNEYTQGKTSLIKERDRLRTNNQQLEKSFSEALEEKEAAIQAKHGQQTEHDQALQQVELYKKQMEQVGRNEKLLEQFQRIEAAYAQRKLDQEDEGPLSMTELELQELIPVYEAQKEAYKQMIQEILDDLPKDDKLQVPLKGILGVFDEGVKHLKRISEEMHFYAELKESLEQLRLENMSEFSLA